MRPVLGCSVESIKYRKLDSALQGFIVFCEVRLTLRTWDLALCIPSSGFWDESRILPLALKE